MKILFVRLRLIGDVVFTTPAVTAVRRLHPRAHLAYVAETAAAPVLQGSTVLDDLIVTGHTRGWRRLRDDVVLARRLRRERFDLVFDFHGGPRGSWLTWATGAPTRVGYTIPGRSWMYSVRVPRSRRLRARHSVENQWDLVRAVFPEVGDPTPERDPVVMGLVPEVEAVMDRRWAAAGLGPGHTAIVVHVSAGNPFRRWPASSFVDLVVRLAAAAPNRRIILTSGPSEADAAARIGEAARRRLGQGAQAIVDLGELSIAEVRSAVARAGLFIGGDSGPLHVAATTTTPIVGIYGPTLPERSAPWRPRSLATESVDAGPLECRPCDQRHCVPGDFRCLGLVSPAMVAAAAERALARAVVDR